MPSRRAAIFAIARWLGEGAFAETLIPDGPDRAFVQDVVYTTIRRKRTLEWALRKFLRKYPHGELEATLLAGAAQILFMPSVPDYAACNETVAAAQSRHKPLTNAILRNLIRHKGAIEAELAAAPLALRESYPDYLVMRWVARYGEATAEALAKWHNRPADTFLAYPDGTFKELPHGQTVMDVPGYAEGAFIVQNPAARLAVELLLPPGQPPPARILDFCAAPGGKTIQTAWRMRSRAALGADSADRGEIVAQEVNPRRRARLDENLARCRLLISQSPQDSSKNQQNQSASHSVDSIQDSVNPVKSVPSVPEGELFDAVLADVPCSNTGVLRKRPDARWRWERPDRWMPKLAALQSEILEAASRHVRPGGRLVYSTCSNEPEENRERVEKFLASPAGAGFAIEDIRESLPAVTGHDGAFAISLLRQ